jgi:hypothetical protein
LREPSQNTKPTSQNICTNNGEHTIDARNGETSEPVGTGKIDLEDTLVIETTDGQRHEYEVVSLVSDPETDTVYGVAYNEVSDNFIVTDDVGNMIEDQELANEIIRDFETFAEESAAEDD